MKTLGIVLLSAAACPAITLMQVETFESGPLNWMHGISHPGEPSLLVDSGPLGVGDTALRIVSSVGGGPGSKLVALNTSSWNGDYVTSGVISMLLDLRNGGTTDLFVRLALNGPSGWVVTNGVSVPTLGGWETHLFDLRPTGLTPLLTADAGSVLGNVGEVRILHSPDPDFRGPSIDGVLLVDNITAVPEPSAIMLALASVAVFALRRR